MEFSSLIEGAVRFAFVSQFPDLGTTDKRMHLRVSKCLIGLTFMILGAVWSAPSEAAVTNPQLAAIFAQSSNSYIAANAQSFANMSSNSEDTTGSLSIYNGSCCYGLMQMNASNIAKYCGCTPSQFGQETAQQQAGQYGAYFTAAQNAPAMQQLEQMAANGETVGGQIVTPAMVAACAGFGARNCAKSIANGCSSTSSAKGGDGAMNICTEAAKTNSAANPNPEQPHERQFECQIKPDLEPKLRRADDAVHNHVAVILAIL